MKKILLLTILAACGSLLQAKDALFSGLEIANRTKKPLWVLIKNGNTLLDPRKLDPNGILTRKKDEKDIIQIKEPIKVAFFSNLPNIDWKYRLDEFLDTFNPNKFEPKPDKLYTFTLNKPIRIAFTDTALQSTSSNPNDVQNKDIEEIPLISTELKKYKAAKYSLIEQTEKDIKDKFGEATYKTSGKRVIGVFKLLLSEDKPTITEKDVYVALGFNTRPSALDIQLDSNWKEVRKAILLLMHPDKMAKLRIEGETPEQRKERDEKAVIIAKTVATL